MFKLHLVKIYEERNPNFQIEGEWRYSRGGCSELCEGDIILCGSDGRYYIVRNKVWEGNQEVPLIQTITDDPKQRVVRYMLPEEGYKILQFN